MVEMRLLTQERGIKRGDVRWGHHAECKMPTPYQGGIRGASHMGWRFYYEERKTRETAQGLGQLQDVMGMGAFRRGMSEDKMVLATLRMVDVIVAVRE